MTIIEIPLGNTFRRGIVDTEDKDLLNFNWSEHNHSTGRAKIACGKWGGTRYLGRVILERIVGRPLAPFEFTGYWNGNGFDCRRKNLFVAYQSEISHRRHTFKNNETGFKGITLIKHGNIHYGKYRSRIYKDGKQIILGYFTHIEHAINAYERAAQNLYGEFALLDSAA